MASKVIEFRRQHQPSELEGLIEAVTIRQPSDVLGASLAIARVVEDHDMRLMVLHDISSQQKTADADGLDLNTKVFGWKHDGSGQWQDYDDTNCSPIIRACRVESEPFWVNRYGFRTPVHNPFLNSIDLTDFEKLSLVKAAIVIPVHLPFGQISVAIISSKNHLRIDISSAFRSYASLFTALSRRFITSYVVTMRDNPYLPAETVLSLREVQCLRWAAFGKTDREIGMILGRSHATIRYHLARVCDKLGAVNRAQSIFRAAQLGYLGSET